MSIWDWVRDAVGKAYQEGDAAVVQIYETYDSAMELRERDPEQSVAILLQARAQAEALGQPWWVQFCDHWRLQALLFHVRDYRRALDLAVECAVETRKPIYRQFPQRVCLHEDLICAYMGIDPEGYAPQIEQSLEYMATEAAPDAECLHCISQLRVELQMRTERYDEAEETALRALVRAREADDSLHAAESFCMLCLIARRKQNMQALGEYAEEAVRSGRAGRHNASIITGLMWQACAARAKGDDRGASRAYRTAIARANQRGSVPPPEYYLAISAFHEAAGDYESALAARKYEIAQIAGQGQTSRECDARLTICSYLQTLGRPAAEIEAELAQAEILAGQLRKPDRVRLEIARLRALPT